MSELDTFPSFSDIEQALSQLNIQSDAAETHGLLCSLFSTTVAMKREAWVDSLLAQKIAEDDNAGQSARKQLMALYDSSFESFNGGLDDQDFALLLPEDAPIGTRIEALAMWCQGFVVGLNLIGISPESKGLSDDVKEALIDLTKMACLTHEDEQDGDSDAESAFNELVEYARVGVMLLYAHCSQQHQEKNMVLGNATKH